MMDVAANDDHRQNEAPQRATREQQNLKAGLLRLSPELRNRIYNDVIPTSARISVLSALLPNQIALLQVCRTIRAETVPIFYGNTMFNFDIRSKSNYVRATSWLHGLSDEAVRSLRKIYFYSNLLCYCKAAGTRDSCGKFEAWIDIDWEKWRRCGAAVDRCSNHNDDSKVEAAKAQASKILGCALEQAVKKEDVLELLEIMRPVSAYEFSFEVAKAGARQAFKSAPPYLEGTKLPIWRKIMQPKSRRP